MAGFIPPGALPLAEKWLVILTAAVLVCFIVSEITRNYSQADKLWSLLPAIYGWTAVAFSPSPRLYIMAILVTAWGLRLSYNFYRKGGYNIIPWKGEEDYRWRIMREKPALQGRIRFGLFNLLFISFYQHFLILLFSSPFLIAAGSTKSLTAIDFAAATFFAVFLIIESIADNQQFRFHLEKKRKGTDPARFRKSVEEGFLSEGLWKYSRHPNFASEQGIWISFYFFSVASSGQWINISLAGAILLVLLFAGSTWLTESISSSKYPAYSAYRKQVARFVPFRFKLFRS